MPEEKKVFPPLTIHQSEGPIDETTIRTILTAVEDQLREKAEHANVVLRTKQADKVKLLGVSATIARDKTGMPVCLIDFSYGEKTSVDFVLRQKALPGMK